MKISSLEVSKKIKRIILDTAFKAGHKSAHIGGALSLSDILSVLYANNFIKFDIVRHDFDTIDKEPIVELKTEITHTLDEDPFKLYPQMDELKRKNFEEADQIAMSLGINIKPLPNTSSIKDANSWSSIDEDDDYE